MDLSNKTVWQVGAGDTDRRYDAMCKEFDVMVVGPGNPGVFDESTYARQGSILRFYQEAKLGDVVVLRLGTGDVRAVGLIADDAPQHLDAFSDIDGWDLQHVRRVRWLPGAEKQFATKTFGGQVRTFARVGVDMILDWVTSLTPTSPELQRPLKQLPVAGEPLDVEELGKRLFVEGLPSSYVDRLVDTLQSVTRVARWYRNPDKAPEGRPSESETVCYLIMPVLLALGWSQQTAAIEWNRIDVALFRAMPPTDHTLECVVEAKLIDRSVFAPVGQAADYARRSGRQGCKRLVVSDGIRYALYHREGDQFTPRAYLNILQMRTSYSALKCRGAVDAILGMAKEPILD